MFSKLCRFYTNHRLISNMGIYFSLYGAGDLTRQTIEGKDVYNFKTTLRMAIVGGCVMAPYSHVWFKFLDGRIVGTSFRHVVKKLVLDSCMSPVFIFLFYTSSSVLEGRKDIFTDAKNKGLRTYKTNLCYWPAVQLFNFRFVSPKYRLPYVAVASYVWTIILSYLKHTWHLEEENGVELMKDLE